MEKGFNVIQHGPPANIQKALFKHLPVGRLIDMQHSLPVFQGKSGGGLQTACQRGRRSLLRNQTGGTFHDDFLQQFGNALEVIVK